MERMLKCVRCGKEYEIGTPRYLCDCGGLLEVSIKQELSPSLKEVFIKRRLSNEKIDESGVWRYREFVLDLPKEHILTFPEGKTNLYELPKELLPIKKLYAKHEGENPTGSFKDRGMTVGVSFAKFLGFSAVLCASTGNTSSSMAAYASKAGLKAFVVIPSNKIAYGKLSQTLAYGAKTIQILGDFDDAMSVVKKLSSTYKIYLLNSMNPIRLEGQKTIIIQTLEQLNWDVPDWIVLPGGNLGNTSAFYKALRELKQFGFIEKVPRLAVIQAENASPFHNAYLKHFESFESVKPETVATAIRIGNPVNYEKAKLGIEFTNGVVESVSDREILVSKSQLDSIGIGVEPASAASLAGAKKLFEKGVIKKDENAVLILTGNILKDPDTTIKIHTEEMDLPHEVVNKPISVENSEEKIKEVFEHILEGKL